MFRVYHYGRPARHPENHVDPSWDNHVFFSFQEAYDYAQHWLGDIYELPEDWDGSVLGRSAAWGFGIEIRFGPPFPEGWDLRED